MLWAAFCLGFFGFLRPGEFTFAPNFPHSGLTVSDVAINSRDNPRVLIVLIRTRKTDQFGKDTHLYLGRTESSLCPVLSMLAYLALQPPTPGPLFIFRDGTPLSRVSLLPIYERRCATWPPVLSVFQPQFPNRSCFHSRFSRV